MAKVLIDTVGLILGTVSVTYPITFVYLLPDSPKIRVVLLTAS